VASVTSSSAGSKTIALLFTRSSRQSGSFDCLNVTTNLLGSRELGAAGDGLVYPVNRKLLRGLVLDARGRGDRIPQGLRYLVEPIALAGNISHVLRLLFVDHSVPLSGVSPARVHYEPLTVVGADNEPHRLSGTGHYSTNPWRTVAVPARTRQR
jgi:hypothetical protein